GGCLSNDPAWLPEYMERTQAMFYRSRNHPCIIAWSLGGDSGNGFNLYRTYMWLRAADPARPIVYRGAGGEWNNDLALCTGPAPQNGNTAIRFRAVPGSRFLTPGIPSWMPRGIPD